MVNVVPWPKIERTSTVPLRFSIRLLTMSMPTPRPEISVIVSAVLMPGCQINAISSRSVSSRASALLTSPLATILSRIFSQLMPRPSSLTVITTLLPRWEASSDTVPARGLPAASRSPGGSSPWSTALRTMWIRGSESSSIIRLSSSVFSPPIWRMTSFPEERLRSRITRRNRSKSGPIGTMRVSSTPFCRPSETRPRLWIASESALSCSRASRIKLSSSWIARKLSRSRRTWADQRSSEPLRGG